MNLDFGVAYIKENSDKRIKITVNSFRGKEYIHIREYGFDGDTGDLFPTTKGIALNPKGLDSVIEILCDVSDYLAKEYENYRQLEFKFQKPDTKEEDINGSQSLVK